MKLQRCFTATCMARVEPTSPLCGACLAKVSDDTRALVGRTYKPGRQASKRLLAALLKAADEIQYFDYTGHRPPLAQRLPLDTDAERIAHE